MLTVLFQGWFQCRLATDPDPYDHPRGDRGWTFAVPGEPDLDRIIRFQDPVALRSYAPRVGVRVTEVLRDGASIPGHPLCAAPVRLLASPMFEGCSGRIATSAQEPIVPFHLQVEGEDLSLERCDPFQAETREDRLRRRPVLFEGQSEEVARATGIRDPLRYRSERRVRLEADLVAARDPLIRQALERRIKELRVQSGIAVSSLGFRSLYRFPLGGEARVKDHGGLLGEVCRSQPWHIEFWMGAWDADALCGYVQGALELAPAARSTRRRGHQQGGTDDANGSSASFVRDGNPAPLYISLPSRSDPGPLASLAVDGGPWGTLDAGTAPLPDQANTRVIRLSRRTAQECPERLR